MPYWRYGAVLFLSNPHFYKTFKVMSHMPKFEDPEFGLVFLNNFLVGGDESNQIFPERVSTSLKKACGNISRGTSLDKICQVFFG